MKQQQLTNNDWQLLSEYLDGQISPRDKASLEKRLQTQVELREGLEELRQTRMILRSATKQRVPRNFTLTPNMVEKARPKPWLTVSSTATRSVWTSRLKRCVRPGAPNG